MITMLMRFQKSYNLLFYASCVKRYSNLKLDRIAVTHPCIAAYAYYCFVCFSVVALK